MVDALPRIVSPKSPSGSFGWSVLVHASLVGGLAVLLNFHQTGQEKSPEYTDLGYQTFEAPPPPAPVMQKVVRAPTPVTPVETKAVPDSQPKEMQDEKSDIAGTQKEAKPVAETGADTAGNQQATPYYKIKPKYPRAALVSGSEGWVLMEIDITESGEVENIRVIDGKSRNMFETEARRAVEQWKYRPFLDGAGKPIRKVAHQVRVDFKLNDTTGS